MITDLAALKQLLLVRGTAQYTGEPVAHLEHALQTARLARRAAAPPTQVVAALLHDVGHLLAHDAGTPTLAGVNDRHEELGAQLLARWFGEPVCAPVRLHVQAKRYLARKPAYLRALSEDSLRSLALQGGAMDEAEATAFEGVPYAAKALALRRWDDAAKRPGARLSLDEFWPVVERAVISAA